MVTKRRQQRLAKKISIFATKQERKEIGKKLDLFFEGKIKRKDLIGKRR